MRIPALLILILLSLGPAFTQPARSLTLEECYQKAKAIDPLSQKGQLLEQAQALRLDNIDAARLPEIILNGEARLQSENVKSPFEIPGEGPIELPLFVARASVDANYAIYDGGVANARRTYETFSLAADQQAITTNLEQLNRQVNQYYFGILLQRARERILQVSLDNLNSKISQLEAGIRYGIVLEGELAKLKVQALRLESQIDQTQGNARALIRTLGNLIGEELPEDIELTRPAFQDFAFTPSIGRQELNLFEAQKSQIMANEQLLTAMRRPQVSAFAQAGFGYPNPLNFFDTKVSPFGIVGLRLRWKIFDWNKTANDRQLLSVQSQIVDNQRQVFEKNLNVVEDKYREELATLEGQLRRDQEIVRLQAQILQQAAAQLDQGVITSSDYLEQVNAEAQARLDLENHRLQIQQLQADYLTHKGLPLVAAGQSEE